MVAAGAHGLKFELDRVSIQSYFSVENKYKIIQNETKLKFKTN